MPYVRTTYKENGDIRREVFGVQGEKCLEIVKPYNEHLPEGYGLTPTEEFYEADTVKKKEDVREVQ